jgi:hypothetical protein
MLALLLAVALVALTVAAVLLAGVVVGLITGVLSLNAFALVVGLRLRSCFTATHTRMQERWQPKHFRLPPEPPAELEHEHEQPVTAYRQVP